MNAAHHFTVEHSFTELCHSLESHPCWHGSPMLPVKVRINDLSNAIDSMHIMSFIEKNLWQFE